MKDKTITVRVPDFCPEDCPGFEIHEDKLYPIFEGEKIFSYFCENEARCLALNTQCVKARGKI